MVRFRALLCLGIPTQCQRLQFYRGPWCQRFYRDFMLKTGWHWKLGARATGVFRSAVNEGQLTPPNLKRLYESNLVPAILWKMMLIPNLSDSNSLEIVNLEIPWRLWFYRCIFKKRVNVSRFITSFITIKLLTPTFSLNSQGDCMCIQVSSISTMDSNHSCQKCHLALAEKKSRWFNP